MSEDKKAYYPAAAHLVVNKSTLPSYNTFKRGTPSTSSRKTLPPKDGSKQKKQTSSPSQHTTRSVIRPLDHGPTTAVNKILEVPEKCEIHPTEDLQFFSFAFNQPLCSSCLLSGAHGESDTMSIKKASETLRHQVADLLIEMEGKLDIFELFVKKVQNRRQELKDIATGYKKEITSTVAQLVSKLHTKEKEMINQIEDIEKNKSAELNLAESKLKSHREEVDTKKKEIDTCLKSLTDLKFCNYFSKQNKILYNLLHDENQPRVRESAFLAEAQIDLAPAITLDSFKASIRSMTSELETFSTVREGEEPAIPLNTQSMLISRGSDMSQSFNRRMEKLGNLSPENTRETMLARYHLTNKVGGRKSLNSPSPTRRPERDFALGKTTIKSGFKDANVNDILRSGYQRLMEVNAKSPAYLTSSLMKRSPDGLGLRDLMASTFSSQKGRSPLESQFLSPNADQSLTRTFLEAQANALKTAAGFNSSRGSPKKTSDLFRSSLREGSYKRSDAKGLDLLDFQRRKFTSKI